MFKPTYQEIPVEFIGELEPNLTSVEVQIINARIDKSKTGTNYLILPFDPPNDKFAILVELSDERIDTIKTRAMNLIYPFQHPEKKFFYLAEFTDDNQIAKLAYLYPNQREFEWPKSDGIGFEFRFIEKPPKFSLLEYSKKRNRCAIEMIFQADDLQENMRAWSFNNVLLPFVSLIKSAILSGTILVNAKNLETKLKFGFTRIEHKCLRAILEFDLNPRLSDENEILKNIENVHTLLGNDDKKEVLAIAKGFSNRKVVPDTIRILRAVIANKATLKSQLATTEEEFKQICLDRPKAAKRKAWLDTVPSSDPYTETVTGYLTRLDFDPKKAPLFSLHGVSGDDKYCGKIAPDLIKKMDTTQFNFRNTLYECQLEVVYTPESPAASEKFDYTLKEINEVEVEVEENE